ncbi:MAG: preprotein translocase subunit YajC [Snodgrassella sp.]|nr:preprotein translocase subunit YajC [Snodgrassella sp.]
MIEFAHAANSVASPNGLMNFLPFALIFVLFYFMMIRPQQAKHKKHLQMIAELKKGDRVITMAGIIGKITKVNDQHFTLEIAPNVEVNFERNSISAKVTD